MKKKTVSEAFIASLPVMAGYVVLGIGFGVVLNTKGYGVLWSAAMSVFIFAGSLEYVAIDLLASHASLAAVAVTALMVNARHLFYGISMIDKYKNAGWRKPYLIFALTDETYSLVTADNDRIPPEEKHRYYFLVSLFDQCWWVSGSIIGSLLGMVIPFSTEGLDFVLTALFITIVVDQWCKTKRHVPALIGIGASLLCLLIFGADSFLIPSMLLITALLFAVRGREEAHHEQ